MFALATDTIGSPMSMSASATPYRYHIGIDCLQLFQLPKGPRIILANPLSVLLEPKLNSSYLNKPNLTSSHLNKPNLSSPEQT
jgi:hypothetical protein